MTKPLVETIAELRELLRVSQERLYAWMRSPAGATIAAALPALLTAAEAKEKARDDALEEAAVIAFDFAAHCHNDPRAAWAADAIAKRIRALRENERS